MSFRTITSLVVGLLLAGYAHAQDEGAVVKKERIERDKGIFVGGGISVVAGSNAGDYSNGLNFEGGYLKRLNRVLSVGGSISYQQFNYDPAILASKPDITGSDIPSNFYYNDNFDQGFFLTLSGGNVSMLSLLGNLKLNFVPVKDNSTISFYGFAKPFISYTSVSKITGLGEVWEYDGIDWNQSVDLNGDPVILSEADGLVYDAQTAITGGIFIGPGLEINPVKPLSIFVQAAFGYTFAVDVVSTTSYSNQISKLVDTNFPIASIGFPSLNFTAGISFNID